MKTIEIKVRNPVALWHEIREFIHTHYKVTETMSFEKRYPKVYHIYPTLRAQSDDVRREAENRQTG